MLRELRAVRRAACDRGTIGAQLCSAPSHPSKKAGNVYCWGYDY